MPSRLCFRKPSNWSSLRLSCPCCCHEQSAGFMASWRICQIRSIHLLVRIIHTFHWLCKTQEIWDFKNKVSSFIFPSFFTCDSRADSPLLDIFSVRLFKIPYFSGRSLWLYWCFCRACHQTQQGFKEQSSGLTYFPHCCFKIILSLNCKQNLVRTRNCEVWPESCFLNSVHVQTRNQRAGSRWLG